MALILVCSAAGVIAWVAGKVGGFTDGVFTGLCGALPVTKRKGGWQVTYNQINYSL